MKRLQLPAQLPFIFGMVAMSFVMVTAFTQWRMAEVDRASLDIADNTAPSIERLSEARSEMRHLQIVLRDGLDHDFSVQAVEDVRNRIDQLINEYLLLPVFPGEHDHWAEILRQKDALNTALARCMAEAERGDLRGAEGVFQRDVSTAAGALGAAFTRDIEFNAAHSRDLARRIRARRVSSTYAAFALDILCAFITIGGGVALRQAMRAHADLQDRHRQLLEEQAAELEAFAFRIAHDILSPLSGALLTFQIIGRRATHEEDMSLLVERGTRSINRVKRLVDGLLGFARAGAKPEAGAHADVNATLGDLGTDLQAAANEVGAKLNVDAQVTCPVACSAGVLTSVLANLARNAIKYIGDGPIRRIDIRARDAGKVVRVEIQDTGPGLPSGFEDHAFEPYVRGRAPTQPGIGLGLATVKRLVEGHGGRVGVRSIPGSGCTFWFELPKVADATSTFWIAEQATTGHA